MGEILVVDDEQDICWALASALTDEGHRVTQVNTGEEAIQEVKRRSFAAAIVDVKLPGQSGIEVARIIGDLDSRLKIVMISGYHYEEDQPIQDGIRRGAYWGFISKPFDLDEVAALVRRLTTEQQSVSPQDSGHPRSRGERGSIQP
ncbi:MAG: response regulator [candidate division NC10 bacterium]